MTALQEPLSWNAVEPIAAIEHARDPLATATTASQLVPVPVEVISGEVVVQELRSVSMELAVLGDKAERSAIAAADVEDRARAEGLDIETSGLVLMQLHQFLATMRADAEDESVATIQAARFEARLMVEDAAAATTVFDARRAYWRALLDERRTPTSAPATSWLALEAGPVIDPVAIEAAAVAPPEVPSSSGAPALSVTMALEPSPTMVDGTPSADGFGTALTAIDEGTEFWPDDDRPRRWVKVRRGVKTTSLLRAGAAVCVVVAVAIQIS